MKKLLAILGSFGLATSPAMLSVIACAKDESNQKNHGTEQSIENIEVNFFDQNVYQSQKVFVGNKLNINIDKWEKYTNLRVTSSDNNILQVRSLGQGKYEVTALAVGNAKITITADNIRKQEREFDVQEKTLLIETEDLLNIDKNSNGNLKILNISDLQNVQVKSNNPRVLDFISSKVGIEGIAAFRTFEAGDVEITITADNAIDKVINTTVLFQVMSQLC